MMEHGPLQYRFYHQRRSTTSFILNTDILTNTQLTVEIKLFCEGVSPPTVRYTKMMFNFSDVSNF